MRETMNRVWKLVFSCFLIFAALPLQAAHAETTKSTIIDDSEVGTGLNQIDYKGTWFSETGLNANWYNGTEHWSNATKWQNYLPSFTVRFEGSEIALFGQKANSLGIYKVQIDNEIPVEVDAYSSTKVHQQKLFEQTGLENKEHVLTFTAQNKINPAGSANLSIVGAQIDYIKVTSLDDAPEQEVFTTNINDSTIGDDVFNFTFSDGWDASTSSAFFGGDEHWTEIPVAGPNPFYNIKFIGSALEIYGVKEASGAIAEVYIDGNKVGEFDTYSPTRQVSVSQYKVDGLSEDIHNAKVVYVARRNPSSTATRFTGEVDYAKATHKAIEATDVNLASLTYQVEKNEEKAIAPVIIPTYATTKVLTYTVADESIATISADGIISAKEVGKTKATISVKNATIQKEIDIEVLPEGQPVQAFIGTTDLHHMQKDYAKLLGSENETYENIAWKGDVINSKIVTLTKNQNITNLKVEASDFTTKKGDKIKSKAVDITWLKDVLVNEGRGNLATAPNVMYPDILYTKDPINAKAKQVNSAWINFNIPHEAKPGTYEGDLVVSADELEEPIRFTYSFTVVDLSQPNVKETSTQLELWQHPFTIARYYGISEDQYFKDEHLGYLKAIQSEYAQAGGRGVVATIVEEAWNHQSYDSDPSMVKWTKKTDGTFTYDYSQFDTWIKLNVDTGVLDPASGYGQIKCYSIVPWGNQITYFDEATNTTVKVKPSPGTANWKTYWNEFLSDFITHVDDKGWLDITYISMDERGISDLEPAVEIIKSIKTADGKGFKISSAMNFEAISDYNFLDKIDDISIGLSHIRHDNDNVRNLADHRREKGLLTTIYNCTGDAPNSFTTSNPVETSWTTWYSMTQHMDGYMRWSYDGWTEKPLENSFYKYWEGGDPFFIYPGEKNTDLAFRSSPRFEKLKQSIRDINKAKFLMEQSPEAKSEIQATLDALARPQEKTNQWGAKILASEDDLQLTINESKRMKDKINEYGELYIQSQMIEVSDIQVDTTDIELLEGNSKTLTANVLPVNATNQDLYWSSGDENVASVSAGVIQAVGEGEAIITVSTAEDVISGISKEIKVIVTKNDEVVAIEDIVVDVEDITIKVGETQKIKTSILPATATQQVLYWTSSNPEVIEVSDGTIRALAPGTATIEVSTHSGTTRQTPITKSININILPRDTEGGNTDKQEEKGKPSTAPDNGVKTSDSTNTFVLSAILAGSATIISLLLKRKNNN